ncbi:choice-of-anchor D domain-containing protein [Sungkyunkwania multivorans]|uniref:Choice-of-anchor D domain-containing protein n=1 Tax=Sungkyunkwania multivorans TaxID=1173618 RepID=A0ABW3CY35_9FLAO
MKKTTFKRRFFTLFFGFFTSFLTFGQVTIANQGFDSTAADTWGVNAVNAGSGTIALSTFYTEPSAPYSVLLRGGPGDQTNPNLILNNVSIVGYSGVTLSVDFAQFRVENTDDFDMLVSYDGGATYPTVITLTDGSFGDATRSFDFGGSTGYVGANPYSFNIPAAATQVMVMFRFTETSTSSNTSDYFFIDNVRLEGFVGGPEMNVTGNGTTIADGDTTPTTIDDTDFGNVGIGTPVAHTFTIENTGGANLNLTGAPNITVSGSTDFMVSAQPALSSVASGGSTTFVVTYTPSALGASTADISIANDDSDENPYNFRIRGTGVTPTPEIDIQGNGNSIVDGDTTPSTTDHTDFGTVNISSSNTRTFTIENLGSGDLTLTGAPYVTLSGSGNFAVTAQPPSNTVGASNTTTFEITYTPLAVLTEIATVTVTSDDSDENPYTFRIQGTGSILPPVAYCEDFELSDGGWDLNQTATNGNWRHGVDGTLPSNGTVRYLYSSQSSNQYQNNALNVAESPVIDLSGYENLVLNLDVYHETESNFDRLHIEFSNDGGTTWYTLGNSQPGEGTNWYNTDYDDGSFEYHSWSGDSGNWFNAEIDLESQAFDNMSDVRFRLSFTSDGSTRDVGVAIDNFCISGEPINTANTTVCGPAGINSDLELWLKADALALTDGASVSTWADLAFGTSWTNATSSVASEQPTYRDNITDNVNGNPVVSFDGNDAMYGKKGFYNDDIYIVIKPGGTISNTLATQDVFMGDDYQEGLGTQDVTGISIGDTSARYTNDIVAYNQGPQTDYGKAIVSTALTYDLPVIFNVRKKADGTGVDLYLDGVDLSLLGATQEVFVSSFKDIVNSRYWLGKSEYFDGSFDGDILEIITYSSRRSDFDKLRIESYLAIKYGINLGLYGIPALGIPHIPVPFYDSNGLPLWDSAANAGYTYNVSGIGRDDCMALNQKESKSIDPNAAITIGLGNIYGTQRLNPNTFRDDMDFLMWGSNDQDLTANPTPLNINLGPSTVTTLTDVSNRIWKVTERATTEIDSVKISIPTAELINLPALAGNDAYVMIVADDDAFTTNIETVFLETEGANQVAYFDFDGTKFFAFGVAHEVLAERHLAFDGTNDYTNVGDRGDLTGPFTIDAWVYSTGSNTANDDKTIVSKRGSGADGYQFYLTNGNQVAMRLSAGDIITSNTVLPNNQWRHVAFIFDGTTGRLYIDGVLDNSAAMASPVDNPHTFTIGGRYIDKNTQNSFFAGNIDEIRMWNTALTVNQLRYVMNQEIIQDGSSNVDGEILPLATTKNDINSVPWSTLISYYNMDSYLGTHLNDVSGNGNRARLVVPDNFNIETQTAPLPYTSTADGAWNANATWANGTEMYTPNSTLTINGTATTIDWNIVQVGHNVVASSDATVLGLISTANELSIQGDSGLTISHYLSLDGTIDLEGESQLIQETDSDLAVTSSGNIERDQQGTADSYTYNYWGSPVGAINTTSNNADFQLNSVFRDGTNPAAPVAINFQGSLTAADGGATSPITVSTGWVYKFTNGLADDYNAWVYTGNTGNITPGEGFTMKGAGTGGVGTEQNYVFNGKPNNGDITLAIGAGREYLVGNPYPSAIDAHEFIDDNLSTTGTLYFWQHWGGGSHNLGAYQGGYALRTKAGGTPAASHPDVNQAGSGTITPGRYVPVAQGFFVVGSTGGAISFENDQRIFVTEASGTSTFTRNSANANPPSPVGAEDTRPKFRIGFQSPNGIHRQLLLTIDPETTNGVDWAYEGKLNEAQMDDMYWMIDNDEYLIQALPDTSVDQRLPLGINLRDAGEITIGIDELNFVSNDVDVYLKDDLTGDLYDLRSQPFSTTLEAGQTHNRFELLFFDDRVLSNEDFDIAEGLKIDYINNSSIVRIVNNSSANLKSAKLISILGQQVATWELTQEHVIELPVQATTGAYVVTLDTDQGTITKKIIVK